MIILAKFTSATDANYVKDLLERNNIQCRLQGDQDSEEVDRIDLILMHEKDIEAAQAILENDVPSEM